MVGGLDYDDMTAGPDEWPIYYIVTASGEKIPISDSERYRLLDV